jgi:hypothetical protein
MMHKKIYKYIDVNDKSQEAKAKDVSVIFHSFSFPSFTFIVIVCIV